MKSGSSVKLVFHEVKDWRKEPALNILSATATLSKFCHVEIAIGEVCVHQTRSNHWAYTERSQYAGTRTKGRDDQRLSYLQRCKGSCMLSHLKSMPCVLLDFSSNRLQELVHRTGLNPCCTYLQIGCSKEAERAMLAYARSCVGKPFSNVGMIRSIFFPRTTDGTSFFCAGKKHYKRTPLQSMC